MEIVGLNRREKIEVVIDTGFDGYLTLPGDLINRLGLRRAGRRYAILIAHYQALEKEYRKSDKYKFVDPPPEKPETPKPIDKEAAD